MGSRRICLTAWQWCFRHHVPKGSVHSRTVSPDIYMNYSLWQCFFVIFLAIIPTTTSMDFSPSLYPLPPGMILRMLMCPICMTPGGLLFVGLRRWIPKPPFDMCWILQLHIPPVTVLTSSFWLMDTGTFCDIVDLWFYTWFLHSYFLGFDNETLWVNFWMCDSYSYPLPQPWRGPNDG